MTIVTAIKTNAVGTQNLQYLTAVCRLCGIQKINRRWNLTEEDVQILKKFFTKK